MFCHPAIKEGGKCGNNQRRDTVTLRLVLRDRNAEGVAGFAFRREARLRELFTLSRFVFSAEEVVTP
jgi:hypothetical protein